MRSEIIQPKESISSYVKSIIVLENDQTDINTVLPFFADGFPGIMFHVTPKGLYVSPQNKRMPDFFLYGQTIHPIELSIEGTYHLIVFQLYPFAVKNLLGIDPKNLNDDCYNLTSLENYDVSTAIESLKTALELAERIDIITSFLSTLVQSKKESIDDKVQQAINLILQSKGTITIRELRLQLHITERTFERQFISQVGVSPKQFSKIIQFQTSLTQLTEKNYSKLTDIVFDNGFADQSHFIKTFKKYTGKTPVKFQPKEK